jgi:hypothetical protein
MPVQGRYTHQAILGAERVAASGVGENPVMVREGSGGRRLAFLGAAVLAIVVALGVAVAWKGGSLFDQTSPEALQRRAQLFWDLQIAGDNAGAYELMASSFRRRVTPAQFKREAASIVRTGATVKSVEVNEKGGLVEVELASRLTDPKFADLENKGTARERWVIEDGAWYRWPPGL